MAIHNYNDYFEKILEKIHSSISKKKFITERELDNLIKKLVYTKR